MAIDTTKHFLEVAEAANILNVSPSTVRRMFDEGILTGFRLPGGSHRRIATDSVFEFINPTKKPEPIRSEA